MKKKLITQTIALTLAGSIILTGCASSTIIQSYPSGANIYINNEPVGTTPYKYRDTKVVGSVNYVRLEMNGYEPLDTYFARDEEVDVGAVVGGVFFLFPFLWTMGYKPTHTYELIPLQYYEPVEVDPSLLSKKSKAEQLRELKALLDENLINQQDYEKQKARILEEKDK